MKGGPATVTLYTYACVCVCTYVFMCGWVRVCGQARECECFDFWKVFNRSGASKWRVFVVVFVFTL